MTDLDILLEEDYYDQDHRIVSSDLKEDYQKKIFSLYDLMNTYRKKINGIYKTKFEEPDLIGVFKKGSQYHAHFDMGDLQPNIFEEKTYQSELGSNLLYTKGVKIKLNYQTELDPENGSRLSFSSKEKGFSIQGEWVLIMEYEDIKALAPEKPTIKLVDAMLHNLFKFSKLEFTPKFKAPEEKDDLTIKLGGDILHIPYIDNSEEFMKSDLAYQELRFSENEEDRKEYEKGTHPVGGKVILTDFDNDIIYISTKKGRIRPFPIHGAQKVSSRDIIEILDKEFGRDDFSHLYNIDASLGSRVDDLMMMSSITGHSYTVDPAFKDIVDDASTLFEANIDDLPTSIGPYKAFRYFAYYFVIKNYSKKYPELKKEENSTIEKNLAQEFDIKKVPTIPMIKKDVEFFPHQGLTLAKIPEQESSVMDLDTGAGKTLMILCDSILQLQSSKAKRPCVVMPNSTIPQQVLEFQAFTDNKMNIIVASSETERNMGLDKLQKTIVGAPVNTLVLASYEWLAKGPTKMYTGLKVRGEKVWKKIFSNSDFLTKKCGVDMLSFDEVHNVKNYRSNKSQACKQLSSRKINIKRGATGTIMPNRPEDIVTIAGIVDSGIFKSHEDFTSEFAEAVSKKGKVEKWGSGAPKKIKARLQESGGLTLRNTHWRYLMPEMVTKVHQVDMSKQQKLLYDNILQNILDEIKADPKLAALWEEIEDSEDDVDIDNDALFSKLIRTDKFLSNPTTEEFISYAKEHNLDALNGLDMVSPKVGAIDKILSNHFSNKDNGKVIVMCNFESAARHILENMAMKSSALYYDAGVKANLDKFETDDSLKVLVAVSQSLDTGLNLQHANRLILVNLDWSIGKEDQKKGRVFRPGQKRKVFVDYLVTNDSSEVTKYARLISKKHIIRQVTSDYEDDTEFEPIKMNIDTMIGFNRFDQLGGYIERSEDMYQNELVESKRAEAYYKKRMPAGQTMIPDKTTGEMLKGGKIVPELQVPQLKRIKEILRSRGVTLEEDVKKDKLKGIKEKLQALKAVRTQQREERNNLKVELKKLRLGLKEETKEKLKQKIKDKISDLEEEIRSTSQEDRKADINDRIDALNLKIDQIDDPKRKAKIQSKIDKMKKSLEKMEDISKKRNKNLKKKLDSLKKKKKKKLIKKVIKKKEKKLKKKKTEEKTRGVNPDKKIAVFLSKFDEDLVYLSVLKKNKNAKKLVPLGFNTKMIIFWKEIKNKSQVEVLLKRIERKGINIQGKQALIKRAKKSKIFMKKKDEEEVVSTLNPVILRPQVTAEEKTIIYFIEHNDKAYLGVDWDEIEDKPLARLRQLGFKRRAKAFYALVSMPKIKRTIKKIEAKKLFITNRAKLENTFYVIYKKRLK